MRHIPNYRYQLAALLAGAALFGAGSQGAWAAGTLSGTTISNKATLGYAVNGVPQTPIESSPTGNTTPGNGNGTATTFVVDNKVNVTVTEVGASATPVVPGQNGAVITFTVTNTGNAAQDFALTAANVTTGSLFSLNDTFDVNNIQVYVDDGNGSFDPNDTATFSVNLQADESRKIFVTANIPSSQISGDAAIVSLTATAIDGNGDPVSPTAGPDNPNAVDIVFADTAGSDDGIRDGKHSARDVYHVQSAVISVQKTATLLCDPINGQTNPKNIPNATVQYAITILNDQTATASAILTTITDTLDTNTTFEPNLVTQASGCTAPENAAGKGFKLILSNTSRPNPTRYFTSSADNDGVDFNYNNKTVFANLLTALSSEIGSNSYNYAAGELKPGESVILIFNVTIN